MANPKYYKDGYLNVYNVDMKRNGTAGGVMRLLQECGSFQMLYDKPSYDDLLDEGKALMVTRFDMNIYEPIPELKTVTMSTWPCPSARATLLRHYTMEADGKLLAEAYTQWIIVDVEERKILKIDTVDFSNFYYAPGKELFSGKLKVSKDDIENMTEVGKHIVTMRDCDYNGHMNNTNYIEIVSDHVPELLDASAWVKSVRFHFVKEAVRGEELSIRLLRKEEGHYIAGTYLSDGSLNVQMEFWLEKY